MRTTQLVISLSFLIVMVGCATTSQREGLAGGYSEEQKANELNKALYQKVDYPNEESPPDWHTPSNWDRIKDGMSEKQVISILGRPTSTRGIGAGEYTLFYTLFYRGDVPGSGFVSGNVQLKDDRVWQVNKPFFDFWLTVPP